MTLAATEPAIDVVLSALDPEQRAAAMLPEGPAQIIGPGRQREDDHAHRPPGRPLRAGVGG